MTRTAPFSAKAIRNACIAAAFAVAPVGLAGLYAIGAAVGGPELKTSQQEVQAAKPVAQAKAPLSRAERAHCAAMTDAYMGVRGEIQAMGLDATLEKAADNDAYQAYLAESERMGCFNR